VRVHLLNDRGWQGYIDLVFYDEAMDGTLTVYRPTGEAYGWQSERLDAGTMIPDDYRFRLDLRTMDALADVIAEQRFGTRQLDTTVIKALEREQGRVDKMIDHLTGQDHG
jgi:hypothetical protein